MATAYDIMTPDVECARSGDSIEYVARRMRERGIGAMPLCREDDVIVGVITAWDIVVCCVADGIDPTTTTVDHFAGSPPPTVVPSIEEQELRRLMSEHGLNRVLVADGQLLLGIVTEADLARHAHPLGADRNERRLTE